MKKILFIALLGIMAMGLASCGKDEVKTFYTVTFDADGGTPVPEKQSVEEGKTAVAPSPAPTKKTLCSCVGRQTAQTPTISGYP